MTTEFVDAVRRDINLLILLAAGTGGGKTESAMRLATGLSGGAPFAVIDTENGRALHKADDYRFKHATLEEPFTPERYAEAVKDADDAGFPVIVIDSGSHEWEGIGGVLDMQAAEFERMGSREGARMASWIEPKARHKRFVQTLLRSKAHVILCLRAEDKVEMVKVNGKTEVRAKESLIGTQGWIPIVEKRLPFEATISLLLLQSNPGVPVPIKLERRHQDLVFTDVPLDEATGERLAAWAKGSGAATATPSAVGEPAPDEPGASQPPSTPSPDDGSSPAKPQTITRAQRARLFAIGREYGVDKDHIRTLLRELTGSESTAELSVEHYESLVQLIQSRDPVNA
jgi:AAA domain-containing protein